MRATALSIWGSRKGSANELSRGRRKFSISSSLAKPLRKRRRAMHGGTASVPSVFEDWTRQSASLQIEPPLSSSGGCKIHRLGRVETPCDTAPGSFRSTRCTDYSIRCRRADNIETSHAWRDGLRAVRFQSGTRQSASLHQDQKAWRAQWTAHNRGNSTSEVQI